MVEFTSVYLLCYRSTCRAHLQSNFAQIWCASILEISEKKKVKKMSRNMFPENALCLCFHVLSFPWDSLDERVGGSTFYVRKGVGSPLNFDPGRPMQVAPRCTVNSGSHLITKVKQYCAQLVLAWLTACDVEYHMSKITPALCYSNK
jgi:hypothetical protein